MYVPTGHILLSSMQLSVTACCVTYIKAALHGCTGPGVLQGPGHNDTTASERTLNVLTCGAFFIAGRKIVR